MRDHELWVKIDAIDLVQIEKLLPPQAVPSGEGARIVEAKAGVLLGSIVGSSSSPKIPIGSRGAFGKPLSEQVKAAIDLELKRFLYLLAISGEALVPSALVAQALAVVLNKRRDFTQNMGLGRMEILPLRANGLFDAAYARTISLRAEEFGPEDPEHIWPKALSIKLQLAGWVALALAAALYFFARDIGVGLGLSLISLMVGGFLWGTEGPWPLNLPFRQRFMARLLYE